MHTGHIRDVGSELVHQLMRVNQSLRGGLSEPNPALTILPEPLLTALALSPLALTADRVDHWNTAKDKLLSTMKDSGLFVAPARMERKLREFLTGGRPRRLAEAERFVTNTDKRLQHLLSNDARGFNTVVWTTLVYAEDFNMRRVVFNPSNVVDLLKD